MVSFSTASQAFYIGKFGFVSWNFPVGSFTRGQKETLHVSGKASWRSWFLDFTAGIGKNTYRLLHWPMFLGTGKIVCTKIVVAYRRSRHLQKKYIMKQTQNHISISIYAHGIALTWRRTHTHTNTLPVTSHSDSVLHQLRCTSSNVFSEGHFCVCPFTWQVALIKQWNQRGMSKFLVLFASTNWDSLYDARSKLANCVR